MAANKYPAACAVCGATVPANGGTLRRRGRAWLVSHTACQNGIPAVTPHRSPFQQRRERLAEQPWPLRRRAVLRLLRLGLDRFTAGRALVLSAACRSRT
jgi:hypothetical protein